MCQDIPLNLQGFELEVSDVHSLKKGCKMESEGISWAAGSLGWRLDFETLQ
jgi:hypothetical protein